MEEGATSKGIWAGKGKETDSALELPVWNLALPTFSFYPNETSVGLG